MHVGVEESYPRRAAVGIVHFCGVAAVNAVLQRDLVAGGGVLAAHVGHPLLILGDGTDLASVNRKFFRSSFVRIKFVK